jgi:hypothetical protein
LKLRWCNKSTDIALLILAHESGGIAEDIVDSFVALGGRWGVR